MILFICAPFKMETSLKGKNLLPEPLRAVSYGMENHFYYIGCLPFNVAIFIMHEVGSGRYI